MKKKPEKDLVFEDSLKKLESIISGLEVNDLNINEAISAFEEGTRLAKSCEVYLNKSAGRVEKIMQDFSGKKSIAPLNEDQDV